MTQAQNTDLNQNSVLLLLRLYRLGTRRKVDSTMVEVDADKEAIVVNKELLESAELEAIKSFDGHIHRYLYARSLPTFGVLRTSAYRLPLGLVEEVDARLLQLRSERMNLIESFLAVYDAQAAEAQKRLRKLYNPGDYPTKDQVAQTFGFEYRYMTLGVPQSLSAALIAREQEKALADVTNEVEEIKLALRTSFYRLVEHAADRLRVGLDGKKMVFRDSLVQNLGDFLAYFGQRNIVGDQDMATLVERARIAMQPVADPNSLRDNADLRSAVQLTMQQIKELMDQQLMLRPKRKLILEEVH